MFNKIKNNAKENRLEFRHITLLLIILVGFQIVLVFNQKSSLQDFLEKTQKWYKQDTAERIANLTTTSLEMLIENRERDKNIIPSERTGLVRSINIIMSQQTLEHNVGKVCFVIEKDGQTFLIDDGLELYTFLFENNTNLSDKSSFYHEAVSLYSKFKDSLKISEHIYTEIEDDRVFNILVPFTPHGEYTGCLYMQNTIDLSNIAGKFLSSYDEIAIIYTSLISLGLLTMYYISSYTLRERDIAQQKLFVEKEDHLKEQIVHEKESMFTKRIYHTHHKAEKVMGFIKEDLRELNTENIEEIKHRTTKYANFISRVIYDMKWYDPPVQTIRGPIFRTNLNELLQFIVDHIILRVSSKVEGIKFNLSFDDSLPVVHVNEFVAWEILEPLIQNSIDHSGKNELEIGIKTHYNEDEKTTIIKISDNGNGIDAKLLEKNDFGIEKIFLENMTTKEFESYNRGYGCYIAYQLATVRCKWEIEAKNIDGSGAQFIIKIKN